jgi:hypothetical protein
MKRWTMIALAGVLAISLIGAAAAFAQAGDDAPPYGPGGTGPGAEGPLHDAMLQAFAEALDLTPEELEERLESGERMLEIALGQGMTLDEFKAVWLDARTAAIQAALDAGLITEAQAERMQSRLERRASFAGRFGQGDCSGMGHGRGWR